VGGVEGIREGEPGAERLIIGHVKAYVMGFECCGGNDVKLQKSGDWGLGLGVRLG
jgi:hypothetical protein